MGKAGTPGEETHWAPDTMLAQLVLFWSMDIDIQYQLKDGGFPCLTAARVSFAHIA